MPVLHAQRGRRGVADRSRHVRISHAAAVARLFPRHVRAQHRAVDGQDQSISGGNFLWLSHAPSRVLEFGDAADRRLVAEQTATAAWRTPSCIVASCGSTMLGSGKLLVIDELLCAGGARHRSVLSNFAPEVRRSPQRTAGPRHAALGSNWRDDPAGRHAMRLDLRPRRYRRSAGIPRASTSGVPSPTVIAAAKIRGDRAWSRELSISTVGKGSAHFE